MTLAQQVVTALDTIEAPGGVFFMSPDGEAKLPAISYHRTNDAPAFFGDDEEFMAGIEYAVDVWGETKETIEPIADQVIVKMKALGLVRTQAQDVPKDETGAMHTHMRFFIIL